MLDINVPLLLVHTTTFLVAMVLIWFLFLKPLLAAMNKRVETVRSDLDGAEQERQQAEELRAKLEKEFRDSRDKIKKELEKAAGEGEEQRKAIREKAQAEAEALLEKARLEIGEEKEKAIQELRGTAGELAVAIAEKLIVAEVDAEKHKQLIDEMISKM